MTVEQNKKAALILCRFCTQGGFAVLMLYEKNGRFWLENS